MIGTNHLHHNRYNQHRLDHLPHYFRSRELQLGNRPWLSEVGKSEQQVEYYELDSRIDNDHLPGNSFQFRLVACLEPDRLATLNFGDMMNQRGYAHLDSLDGVPFEMPKNVDNWN